MYCISIPSTFHLAVAMQYLATTEYKTVSDEMHATDACITSYVSHSMSFLGIGLFGVGALSIVNNTFIMFSATDIIISTIMTFIVILIIQKITAYNLYAAYCSVLSKETLPTLDKEMEDNLHSYEFCCDQQKNFSSIDAMSIRKIHFGVKNHDFIDNESMADIVLSYIPRIKARNTYEQLRSAICSLGAMQLYKSATYYKWLTAMLLFIVMILTTIGFFAGALEAWRVGSVSSAIALLVVVACQAGMGIFLLKSIDRLNTINAIPFVFWQLLMIRAKWLNDMYHVTPVYMLSDLDAEWMTVEATK